MEDVTTETNPVDLRKASTKVWLVKVPAFLAKAWEDASFSDNLHLGEVKIDNVNGQTKFTVTAVKPTNAASDIPKEYDMTVVNSDSVMKVFSEDISGNIAFEGTVERKCDMKPKYTTEYRAIMKNRNELAQKKTRFIQTLEKPQNQPYPKKPPKRRDSPERPEKDKFERIDKGKLLDMLFNAFETKDYWTFKQLAVITKQPHVYLKENLNEICDYNKRGANKSYYQLKEQFKKKDKSSTTEATPQ